MTPPSPTALATRRVPFSAFKTFPPLFERYCTAYEDVAEFYAGDFRSAEARRAAADRAAAHERDRATLADVLLEQNERWGLGPKTRENIEALRERGTVAVVTGQQVGFLTGPLYTVYKTITALQLAEQLAEETGRTVVPVFWVEGEDHDFEEIAGVTVLSRNEARKIRYAGPEMPHEGNLGAVGRLPLDGQAEAALGELDEALPPTEFKDALMARVRDAYAADVHLEDAFVRLLRDFFPEAGLVFLNPDDVRLKALTAPLFRREIEDGEAAAARVERASEKLRGPFHAQVQARPLNLFLLDASGRHPIDLEGDGRFRLRNRGRSFTKDELLGRLDEAPEQFSPNVILRPLMQDLLLPTAAYVAGPGEVSYFAQYKGVYDWAGIPMPIIYPRASATLVESKVQKVLERYGLGVADFEEETDKVFRRLVVGGLEADVDEAFKGCHAAPAPGRRRSEAEGAGGGPDARQGGGGGADVARQGAGAAEGAGGEGGEAEPGRRARPARKSRRGPLPRRQAPGAHPLRALLPQQVQPRPPRRPPRHPLPRHDGAPGRGAVGFFE